MNIQVITRPLWRDGYLAAAQKLEKLAREYREICDRDACAGDPSVGIPACPFYVFPDIDAEGKQIRGGCELELEEDC